MRRLFRLTPKDFPGFREAILAIERASFPTPWTVRAFEEEVRNPVSHLWVSTQEQQLEGYICFWVVAGEVHLMNVAVRPEIRRVGVGSLLLSKMIEAGISEGARCVWLEVRPSNRPALALYEKAGFREVGRRRRYYMDTGEDAVIMVLDLETRKMSGGSLCV